MVGDLVVVDIVDVDAANPAHHLLGDDCRVEVAQETVAECAKAGERPRTVHAGEDVEATLTLGLESFADPLDDRAADASGEAVRAEQEAGEHDAGTP